MNRSSWSSSRVVVMLLLAALAAGVFTGCGSDDEASSSGGAAQDSGVEQAKDHVKKLFEGEGYAPPPKDSPPAQKGARVAMINVGQQAPTGATVTQYAKQANKVLGWDLSIYDAAYSPAKYQEGIREAIAQKVDAIWLFAIDCPLAKKALQEAKNAKIPVVSFEGVDCSDLDPDEPSLYTANLKYAAGSVIDWGKAIGTSQADWIIAETDGKAKIIQFVVLDLFVTKAGDEGFTEALKKCKTCEVVERVELTADILGPKLQERAEQALLRSPEANAILVQYDDLALGGVSAAIRGAGRNQDELDVVGGTGFEPALDLVRKNQGLDSGFGVAYDYETYAAADLVNRIIAGEKPPATSGLGIQFYDRTRNMPKSGDYKSPIDVIPTYEEMWKSR